MSTLVNSIKNRDYDEVVKLVEAGADLSVITKDMLQLGHDYDKIVEHFKIVNYLRPKIPNKSEVVSNPPSEL